MSEVKEKREEVRAVYAQAASNVRLNLQVTEASSECCDTSCCSDNSRFGATLYKNLEDKLPDAALLASLGCGNPTAVAEMSEGETVLDLGSGGGIDVLLSAKRVGPTGKVYGLDMTEEMLELAEKNRADAGAENVEFLQGYIEDVPLPDAAVDVIISNCVINLSTDKPAVFAEMARVLKPGGRIGLTDVVADNELTPQQRLDSGSFVGCIAGALSYEEYEKELTEAGFEDISVERSHQVMTGMWSAIIKATKPAA